MPYVAKKPDTYLGRVVGSGQCVAYVQQVCGAPQTKKWQRGAKVQHLLDLEPGTAIATFGLTGTYLNDEHGLSHAAVYLTQNDKGLLVLDQWKGQPVHQRLLRFGAPLPINNGECFYVIEPAGQATLKV